MLIVGTCLDGWILWLLRNDFVSDHLTILKQGIMMTTLWGMKKAANSSSYVENKT